MFSDEQIIRYDSYIVFLVEWLAGIVLVSNETESCPSIRNFVFSTHLLYVSRFCTSFVMQIEIGRFSSLPFLPT